MKKILLCFITMSVLILLLIACQAVQQTEDVTFFFKDDEGNILATEFDIVSGSAEILYIEDPDRHAIRLEFIDVKKLEDITTDNLNKPIRIYYKHELLTSPIVSWPITDGNIVIESNEFTEEMLIDIIEALNN